MGQAWSVEIQEFPESLKDDFAEIGKTSRPTNNPDDGTSVLAIYEQTIRDPKRDTSSRSGTQSNGTGIEIETEDMQAFFTKQLEVLEQLKFEDERDRAARKIPKQLEMSPNLDDSGRVNEHIGPVQFNMGGIQVDADDMVRKLKVSCCPGAISLPFFEPELIISTGKGSEPSCCR